MSKPYQTETYEIIVDTKEYLDLFQDFNQIGSIAQPQTGILGSGTIFGNFNISKKSNFINYSNGIITISKSGYYTIGFNGIPYNLAGSSTTLNPIFSIKKNDTIIEKIYPVLANHEIVPTGSGIYAVNVYFESSIFYVNNNEEIKVEITIGGIGLSTPLFINCKLNIKEI